MSGQSTERPSNPLAHPSAPEQHPHGSMIPVGKYHKVPLGYLNKLNFNTHILPVQGGHFIKRPIPNQYLLVIARGGIEI